MKDVDDIIIDKTMVKPDELEVNSDDNDGLEFVGFMDIIENKFTGANYLKDTDDDSQKGDKYDEDIEQESTVYDKREYGKLLSEAKIKVETKKSTHQYYEMVHNQE